MVQVLCPVVVGREAELAVIDAGLDAARAGGGGCVVLTGEAGIGKSRLARETARRAAAQEMTVLTGRAAPTRATTAYGPITEALQQGLRTGIPDDPDLAPWLPALSGIVPRFGSGVPTGGEPSVAVRAEAVIQLLSRLAHRAGLVLILEDMHWADPDSVALVEYLADNVSTQPILLVVTVRSEEPSAARDLLRRQRGRPDVTQLELDRLDTDHVVAMVHACSPDAATALVDRVSRSAEGIPLLVEELLASPGVPTSFAETVQRRLDQFHLDHRVVIEAAAILGRRFDWQLLLPMTGLPSQTVTDALGAGVERLLLRVEEGAFRFRHALTREAVLAQVLPPRQVEMAQVALAALDTSQSEMNDRRRDLAADLAIRAGDKSRAGRLLTEAGRTSLRQGALATATETFTRAIELLARDPAQADAGLLLVESLALAGRVDEAVATADRVIPLLRQRDATGQRRAEAHLRLAHASVAAARWSLAKEHLEAARRTGGAEMLPASAAGMAVLEAEVALASDDAPLARCRAEDALAIPGAGPESQCHALEVIGRIERFDDRDGARLYFERALATAEEGDLAIWRLRALHELGTIDMFDHLGTERLDKARRTADELGALSTGAVIDLQLGATFIARWDPDAASHHAGAALDLAEALQLHEVRSKALVFLAEAAALRSERDQVERFLALSAPSEWEGTAWEGFRWGIRGEALLTSGDRTGALECHERGATILGRLTHAEPAAFRATWPLLLASVDVERAAGEIETARRLGIEAFNLNRGLLGCADAMVAGRGGDPGRANELSADADLAFVNAEVWRVLARVLASGSAAADGWGDPAQWLADGAAVFAEVRLPRLAEWCRAQLAGPAVDPWSRLGITKREEDVVRLVVAGLANKEIAARLTVSPRTVEKHIESLLRKTGARTRTQLAVFASDAVTGVRRTGPTRSVELPPRSSGAQRW